MKLVVNKCYGGFSFSDFAIKELNLDYASQCIDRDDPALIALIEKYGSKKCSSQWSNLEIVEIPDEATDYRINEYDGYENVIYVQNGLIWDAD